MDCSSSERSILENLQISIATKNVEEIERLLTVLHKNLLKGDDRFDEVKCDKNSIKVFSEILQSIPSFLACKTVIYILEQFSSKKSSKKANIKILVVEGMVQVLLSTLVNYQNKLSNNNLATNRIHTVIKRLARKDKKTSIKARLTGAAGVTASLVQLPANKFSTQCSLLLCLKTFLSCHALSSTLGKDGLLKTLIDNLSNMQENLSFKSHLLFALTLETVSILLKLKINITRFIEGNGFPRVLQLMEIWYKSESKLGRRISKACLMIISQCTDIIIGCDAIISNDGKARLHKIATALPSGSPNDVTVSAIFSIVLKCSSISPNPAFLKSPFTFNLPGHLKHKLKVPVPRKKSPASDDEAAQEALLSVDRNEETEKLTNSLNDLSIEDEYSKDYLQKLAEFFPEQICYHPSSMKNYPCCNPFMFNFPNVEAKLENNIKNSQDHTIQERYSKSSKSTKSVTQFVKAGYPDFNGVGSCVESQNLLRQEPDLLRQKMLYEMEELFDPSDTMNDVVYDVDFLVNQQTISHTELSNEDEKWLGKNIHNGQRLSFESRFESGNLRKAVKIDNNIYNLIISPDINSENTHQWFYFQVSGMESDVSYTFNVINCEKYNSQFNYGMQPLLFSVKDATEGKGGWRRTGSHICYHKNRFRKFTSTFTMKFPHSLDVCYLAYHFPYTYTTLQIQLSKWILKLQNNSSIFYNSQLLCKTLGGNDVNVITITHDLQDGFPLTERKYIFLSARVHPGETNSSWAMQGSINFLISDDPLAEELRKNFIFKIVPMLNPDGVINGNQRCSLLGVDLNRCWSKPNSSLHPEIFYAKGLMAYLQTCLYQSPEFFCDYHGHSRKKNVFMFGCSPRLSWFSNDKNAPDDRCSEVLVKLFSKSCKAFSYSDCNFSVEKSRESTARVTVWRKLKCVFSYTLESSYCGFNQGPYEGLQITTSNLEEMGSQLCNCLIYLVPSSKFFPRESIYSGESNKNVLLKSTNGISDSQSDNSENEGSISNDTTEEEEKCAVLLN